MLAPFRDGRPIGTTALLAAVYFAAAKLGLALAFLHPSATPVWPPTGIALAALLLLGTHAWPGIFIGAFLANLTTVGTVWTSLGIAVGNTLEAAIGAFLVNRYANGRHAFSHPQDIFKFAMLAAVAATAVSPTIGVTSLALGGFASWGEYRPIWLTWWLGDAAGALIAAPLIVLWSTDRSLGLDRGQLVERATFLVALFGVCRIVFGGIFPFAYLTVPFLVWAAFRFSVRDTASVIALLAAIAVWGTVRGLGPFVGATPNDSLLFLQAFMGIMAIVALPLASVVAERRAAAREVRERERRFRALTEHSADIIALFSPSGRFLYLSPAVERVLGYRPEELVGRRGLALVPRADIRGVTSTLADVVGHPGRPVVIEHTYRHKDGTIRWLESTITDMRSEPAVQAITVNFRDITERKAVEQTLHRKQADDELIGTIAAKTAGETDLGRVLVVALEELKQTVGFTGGSIALVEGEDLIIRAAVGPFAGTALGQRMPRGGGRSWEIVATRTPFLCNDLAGAGIKPTTPIRSYLAVPLSWQGRAFGVLEVDSVDADAFRPADLDLLQRVATTVSGSIELARRFAAEVAAKADAEAAREQRGRLYRQVSTLQRVTASLVQAITPQQVIDVIVEHGAQAMGAQAAAFYQVTDQGEALELVRTVNYPEEMIEPWRRYPLSFATMGADAARTRQTVFVESGDELRSRYPDAARVSRLFPDAARVAVPLVIKGETIGVLVLNFDRPRTFDQGDREVILAIARQCGQALERARLYERDHTVAETLQRALLPEELPQVPGITIHAAYLPGARDAEVGGDWYDVFRLPGGQIAFSVGDVVGRGLAAAVLMGQFRQAIRAAALERDSPSMVLAQANRIFLLTSRAEGLATALFGVLDPATLAFAYAVAGHPGPALATADGRVEILEAGGALPLGTRSSKLPPTRSVTLSLGALLVLYTDGLIELTRSIDEGEAALLSALRAELGRPSQHRAEAILKRVLAAARAEDDIAIVTASVSSLPLERLTLAVPARPSSLRDVRLAFRRLAEAQGLDQDRAMMFEIALGEAISNVVEHAYGADGGDILVSVWRDVETLIAEIEDHGHWRKARNEGRGYGLQIMRGMLDSVQVTRRSSGTTVRLVLSLAPSSVAPTAASDPPPPPSP